MVNLSLARRLANADIPTGPTLAACGDDIARKVAFTAPFSAAVVESRNVDVEMVSIGCVAGKWACCKIHG